MNIPLLLDLFIRFLKIGVVGFGGGWAILPIIEREVVEDAGWITSEEYSNLVAIAGSTPGPITVNAATYIGFKLAGLPGALIATFAVILPPLTIVSIIAYTLTSAINHRLVQALLNGLKAAVIGLIIVALIGTIQQTHLALPKPIHTIAITIIAITVITLVMVFKIHPIVAIILSAMIGLVLGAIGLW